MKMKIERVADMIAVHLLGSLSFGVYYAIIEQDVVGKEFS
jgi:hypothetical protein